MYLVQVCPQYLLSPLPHLSKQTYNFTPGNLCLNLATEAEAATLPSCHFVSLVFHWIQEIWVCLKIVSQFQTLSHNLPNENCRFSIPNLQTHPFSFSYGLHLPDSGNRTGRTPPCTKCKECGLHKPRVVNSRAGEETLQVSGNRPAKVWI